MDPIYKPLTKDQKQELEKKGYKEWSQPYSPKWCDPGEKMYYVYSALFFGASLYGRQWARRNFFPSLFFTGSAMLVPATMFAAIKHKHVNTRFSPYLKKPSFNETLERFPVTRRAWKRAMILREQEMNEMRNKLSSV